MLSENKFERFCLVSYGSKYNTTQNSSAGHTYRGICPSKPGVGEAAMSVLGGHPAFKGREEQIGRYTSKHAAQKQQLEVGVVLQKVDDDLQNAVDDA